MRQKHSIEVETVGLHPRVCHICGKAFECRYEYAYKRKSEHGPVNWFCSYKCLRDHERRISRKRYGNTPPYEAQKILRLLSKGKTITQVADELGIRYQRVSEIRDKWENWEVKWG